MSPPYVAFQLYFELVKLRTAFGIQRTAKNCFHMLRSLLQSLEPDIVRDMPLGSDLPLMKLRAPSNPSSASNYVLFFGGSFSPVHLNHLSVMQVRALHCLCVLLLVRVCVCVRMSVCLCLCVCRTELDATVMPRVDREAQERRSPRYVPALQHRYRKQQHSL